jgi:crotonobetainyl-CoA:carnitine CoA-transferase CaiB-like acyl-CoA transferase
MAFPLEGIRVIDMTIWQQGTYSTAMLADMGADVIKIEGPDSPDPGRGLTLEGRTINNAYFQSHNRSKRAICLDLNKEEGRAVLYKLTEEADVFVSNMRLRALKKLGADYPSLSKVNPRLIYGRASGYGPKGPDASVGSMDIMAQARGGIMSVTGDPDGWPKPVGVPFADHVGALTMAFGLMVALFHRERTGEGQEVDASLLAGQLCIQSFNITGAIFNDMVPGRRERAGLSPTWNVYKGSDGKYFVIGMSQQRYWPGICEITNRPEWLEDERYGSVRSRAEHREELFNDLDAVFGTKTADEWVKLFSDADLLAARVHDYAEVISDPQNIENGYITEVANPDGPPVRMVGVPVILSKTPGKVRSLAPEMGQHTEEVMLEAGYSWEEIAGLRAKGAIGLPE